MVMDHAQSQQTELKQYADRLEHLCRAQAAEITKLRDELARATEGAGALAVLQSLYRDPAMPQALRAKCAIGCLPHEEPRLLPERQLELKAEEPPEPLADLIARQRRRADQMMREARDIEVLPSGLVRVLPKPGSNGSSDGSGDST